MIGMEDIMWSLDCLLRDGRVLSHGHVRQMQNHKNVVFTLSLTSQMDRLVKVTFSRWLRCTGSWHYLHLNIKCINLISVGLDPLVKLNLTQN